MAIRDPERYFDSRTIQRHLKRGHATEADYQAHLDALPDLADSVKANDEGGDDDGFENRGKRGQASSEPRPLGLRATMPTRVASEMDYDDDDDDDDDYDDDDDDDDDDDVAKGDDSPSAVVVAAPAVVHVSSAILADTTVEQPEQPEQPEQAEQAAVDAVSPVAHTADTGPVPPEA